MCPQFNTAAVHVPPNHPLPLPLSSLCCRLDTVDPLGGLSISDSFVPQQAAPGPTWAPADAEEGGVRLFIGIMVCHPSSHDPLTTAPTELTQAHTQAFSHSPAHMQAPAASCHTPVHSKPFCCTHTLHGPHTPLTSIAPWCRASLGGGAAMHR